MGIFSEIKDRIKAPTPRFWKRVRALCISLGTIGGMIYMAPDDMHLPIWLKDNYGYLITLGFVGTILSQLTRTTPQEQAFDLRNYHGSPMMHGGMGMPVDPIPEEQEQLNDPLA